MVKALHDWTDEEIEQASRGSRAFRVLNALVDPGGMPEIRADDVRRVIEAAEAAGVADDAMRQRAAELIARLEPVASDARGTSSGAIHRTSRPGKSPDAIACLIDRALTELGAAAPFRQVYALLEAWARQHAPPPPLLRPASGHIEYSDRGQPKKLTPENVRDRMRPRRRTKGASGHERAHAGTSIVSERADF